MEINVRIEYIKYQSAENGFAIVTAKHPVHGRFSMKGTMPGVKAGQNGMATGEFVTDRKWGRQFQVESWEEKLPETKEGVERYLASGMIRGIGPAFARRIVGFFGENTMNVLDNSPERLLEIPGIGRAKVEKIAESWTKQKDIKHIMVFLQGIGVSTGIAVKVYKAFGKEAIAKVKTNPYCLADEVSGIGFKTADEIAEGLGLSKDSEFRIRSGIRFALSSLAKDGHVYATRDQLVCEARNLLNVEGELICKGIMLDAGQGIIEDNGRIYLPSLYAAEVSVAWRLIRLGTDGHDRNVCREAIVKSLAGAESYEEFQLQAICDAVNAGCFILTGGPGTGKTTTLKGIISVLNARKEKILLAAPTGRAAKRMSEATGMEAKTIHRLLEYTPSGAFARNAKQPLEGDTLIIDEASMIDIRLMDSIMQAVPAGMRLILVGDTDQLPSVGAGNVLRDIIASGTVKTVRLTRIFRQAGDSMIITNSHRINSGMMPVLQENGSDCLFIGCKDPEEIGDVIVRIASGKTAFGKEGIQVLTPMHKGAAGCDIINERIQAEMNLGGKTAKRGSAQYHEGDKVMQQKNNYDKGVFNGDCGVISKIDIEEGEVQVTYDERTVTYEMDELDEISLAYACTIHKSQGSEYPIVVMPMTTSHYVMLQRNLLYTGITRARRMCIVVGQKEAVAQAVRNATVSKRNTLLAERLADEEGTRAAWKSLKGTWGVFDFSY